MEVVPRLIQCVPAGEEELQCLLEGAADYRELVTGSPPPPGAARIKMSSAPKGLAPGDRYFLALDAGGATIGYADLLRRFPELNTAVIVDLVLLPGYRGCGLGRLGYMAVERLIAGWAECSLIRLGVLGVNATAIGFWRRMGFTPTGECFNEQVGSVETDVTVLTKPLREVGVSFGD